MPAGMAECMSRRVRRSVGLVAAALLCLPLAGCGSPAEPRPAAGAVPTSPSETPPTKSRLTPSSLAHRLPDCQHPTVTGTEGDDDLRGSDGDDVITGLGGDDAIKGGDGNDVLCGGAGADRLGGGEGDDVLHGGDDGQDVDRGGDPVDVGDRLTGGAGDDIFDGGGGDGDLVSYASAPHGVVVDLVAQAATGDGDDRFTIQAWQVYGSPHDDVLVGTERSELFLGGGGNDVIYGLGGDDGLDGNGLSAEGGNLLYGRDGDDVVVGGPGDDQVDDEQGADHLSGGPGDDVVQDDGDGSGPNWLFGGTGNDRLGLNIGIRHDHLDGGPGRDTYTVDTTVRGIALLRLERNCGQPPFCDG